MLVTQWYYTPLLRRAEADYCLMVQDRRGFCCKKCLVSVMRCYKPLVRRAEADLRLRV